MSDTSTLPSRNPNGQDPRLHEGIYRQAIQAAPVPILIVSTDGRMVLANSAAGKLFGYPEEELLGEQVEVLIPEALRSKHRQYRDEFAEAPTARTMGLGRDVLGITRGGEEIPLEVGLTPIGSGDEAMVVCAIVDLRVRKQDEKELADVALSLGRKNEELLELAATDSLTSLKNRRVFLDHLAFLVEASVRHARPLSVLILDIDHFKDYNDSFGHLAGDEVLRKIGRILGEVARRSDVVARLGGEEFGILLPETDRPGAGILAERFRKAIEGSDWPRRAITASIGSTTTEVLEAVPRPPSPDLSEIMRRADLALYASKRRGRNRVTHSEDMGVDD